MVRKLAMSVIVATKELTGLNLKKLKKEFFGALLAQGAPESADGYQEASITAASVVEKTGCGRSFGRLWRGTYGQPQSYFGTLRQG